MIYIGICDDEKEYRELIHKEISDILFRYDEMKFFYYSSGADIIEAIEKNEFQCELLFLDINMPLQNGLDTAAYIRKHQIDVDIFFVTVSVEHVFDGYTYQAFSYLLKPVEHSRLSEELERYMTLRNDCSHCLHINIGGKKVQIFLDKVKYFMADGRKIVVCQRGGVEELAFYAKMSDLEATLSHDDFIRCHQSYLVNTKYVESHTRTEIDVGGEILPISRRYVEQIRECFNTKGGEIR